MPDVAPGVTTRTAVSTRAAGVSEETSEHELASVRTMLTEVQRARSAWTDSVRWVDALVSAVVGRRRGDGADDCQRAEAGRGRLNGGAEARRKRAPGVRLAPGRTPGAGAAPRLAPLRETGQRVEGRDGRGAESSSLRKAALPPQRARVPVAGGSDTTSSRCLAGAVPGDERQCAEPRLSHEGPYSSRQCLHVAVRGSPAPTPQGSLLACVFTSDGRA